MSTTTKKPSQKKKETNQKASSKRYDQILKPVFDLRTEAKQLYVVASGSKATDETVTTSLRRLEEIHGELQKRPQGDSKIKACVAEVTGYLSQLRSETEETQQPQPTEETKGTQAASPQTTEEETTKALEGTEMRKQHAAEVGDPVLGKRSADQMGQSMMVIMRSSTGTEEKAEFSVLE